MARVCVLGEPPVRKRCLLSSNHREATTFIPSGAVIFPARDLVEPTTVVLVDRFVLCLVEKFEKLAMKLGQVLKRSRVLYFQFVIFAPAEKDSHTHNYKTQAYCISVPYSVDI